VSYPLGARRPDLEVSLEHSVDLEEWNTLPTEIIGGQNQAAMTGLGSGYYRIRILKLP
jgi:hypothetical protein